MSNRLINLDNNKQILNIPREPSVILTDYNNVKYYQMGAIYKDRSCFRAILDPYFGTINQNVHFKMVAKIDFASGALFGIGTSDAYFTITYNISKGYDQIFHGTNISTGWYNILDTTHRSKKCTYDYYKGLKITDIDGNVLHNSYNTFTNSFTISENLIFGAGKLNGTYQDYCEEMTIYSLQLYNGNTLDRDFVPAMKTDGSVSGLFDKTNNIFYAGINANWKSINPILTKITNLSNNRYILF